MNRRAAKQPRAGDHLVQHDAKRPDVSTPIDRLALSLFRRHVGGRTQNGGGTRRDGDRGAVKGRLVQDLGQAEVEHLDQPAGRQHHVGRLQIAMDDAFLVRSFERDGNLCRDRQRLVHRDRATRKALGEIVTFDEFHHQGGHAPALLEPVDGGNVRMVQRGEDFSFALKTSEPIVVSPERGRKILIAT